MSLCKPKDCLRLADVPAVQLVFDWVCSAVEDGGDELNFGAKKKKKKSKSGAAAEALVSRSRHWAGSVSRLRATAQAVGSKSRSWLVNGFEIGGHAATAVHPHCVLIQQSVGILGAPQLGGSCKRAQEVHLG